MKFIVDDNIPFIKGRLEPFGEVVYTDQFGFTPELVRDADALIIRTRTRCDAALLEGSKVSLVATATIGMDQIEIPWCTSHGIEVRNAPGCNAPGVAQYVWASLLREGFDPKRHTIGVVGNGNVGTIVAEWGRLLGAKVLLNDPPKAEREGEGSNEYIPLDELLRKSDAVTLHTPLTKTGKHPSFHLIGARELSLMKPGAILVNAARGPVIDTPAVVDALKRGAISTIIDTWEGEPDTDPELRALTSLGTFHIAGYSHEGKQRATRMVLEAVNEKFGIDASTDGLAPAYSPKKSLTPAQILESYDPRADHDKLMADPANFDIIRRNYVFRHEC